MKTKPLVYLAGPFTSHPTHNTNNMAQWWNILQWGRYANKATFICPHWSALQDMVMPRTWEEWLKYDKELLDSCDAVIRIHGESTGADEEVAYARKLGLPVFFHSPDIHSKWGMELQKWIENWKPLPTIPLLIPLVSKPKRLVVGFMGHPGRGKTTISKMVINELMKDNKWSCFRRSFAEPIRQALATMGVQKQGTDDAEYRAMATALSSIRDFNPKFYVDKMKGQLTKDFEAYKFSYKFSPQNFVVLIDDVRYENETALCDYIFLLDSWDMPNRQKWAEKGIHKSEQYCYDILKGHKSLQIPAQYCPIQYGEQHLRAAAVKIADQIRNEYVGRLYQ